MIRLDIWVFFGCHINYSTDVTHKRSDFIGYFNKLMSNFTLCLSRIQLYRMST